jgi:dihydrofolate reductase
MTSSGFSVVVAMDRNRGIGNKGDLPWPKLKGDMKFFRELTTCPDRAAVEKRWGLKAEESAESKSWEDVSAMLKFAHSLPKAHEEALNVVLMGRKTWESLPETYRPLPDRWNSVISRGGLDPQQEFTNIFPSAIKERLEGPAEQVLVIGGGQVFAEAVRHSSCSHLYITEIDATFECDTHFPETPDFHPVLSSPWIEENGIRYRFRRYDRVG